MPKALHLIPDAPITSSGFDRLDRMGFVRSFAEAIRSATGEESVVLALAGPWGSGKSSLLNLIAHELQKTSGEPQPLVMRFNPWWFTGTEQLAAAFLQQLGAAVSRPAVKEKLGDATVALDRLAEALAAPSTLAAMPALHRNLDGGPASGSSALATRDIEEIRHTLDSIFRNCDRRILIFMDDIDRLTPKEMSQLLLIVRAVADFPKTTYVLSFDYEVVVEAIGDKLGVDGRTYLEKVVQLQVDVPLPGRKTLERMFVGQLAEIDPAAMKLDLESQKYFRMLFEGGIKHFLATPRACTRLLNVLRFTYPTVSGEVCFPDMLGICCLMSFSSQAIHAIRSYSDAFVGHCDAGAQNWANLKGFHASWLGKLPKKDFSAVRAIVRLLFPKVAWALNAPAYGEEYVEVWQKQRRVCSVKHFETYFRLGLTSSEAAEHQWQSMVELLDDATAFARALHQFGPLEEGQESGWVGELLQQARDFVNEQANPDQACKLFLAIMRRGDHLAAVQQDDSEDGLLFEPIHWVVSLLLDCLLRIDDPSRRFEVLKASVSEDAGLLTAAELIDLLDYRVEIFADGTKPPTEEENTAKLMEVLKILDARIQEASENGELAKHPQFMKIVHKWYQFGRRARSRKWIRDTCNSDERLVEALMQVRSSAVQDNAGQPADFADAFPIELLEDFFDRDEMLTRCENILEESPAWLTAGGTVTLESLATVLRQSS